MARLLKVPLLIHESNAVVGLTNKWLAKIASQVLVGFPDVLRNNHNHHYVGNPVRKSIAELPAPDQRLQGRSGRLNLLVVGGSLGAQVLNETIPAALANMDSAVRCAVRHQAGRGKLESTLKRYHDLGVEAECSEFIVDMAEAYCWADIVICRAGAITVAEIAAAGTAAIFVPYPHAIYDHQTVNAQFLTNQDAAILMPQQQLSDHKLAAVLTELSNDRPRLLRISQRARQCASIDATRQVADICNEVMHA